LGDINMTTNEMMNDEGHIEMADIKDGEGHD
jgi:hypothetical protein